MFRSEEVWSIFINFLEYWCWHLSPDPEGILFYTALSDLDSKAGKINYSVFYNSEKPRAIRIDFLTTANDSSTRFASVCSPSYRGFRSLTTSVHWQFLTKDTVSDVKSILVLLISNLNFECLEQYRNQHSS